MSEVAVAVESKKHIIVVDDDDTPIRKAAKKGSRLDSVIVANFHDAFNGEDEFNDRKALRQGTRWIVNFPVTSHIDCFNDGSVLDTVPEDIFFELVFDKSSGYNACVRSINTNSINSFTMSLMTTFTPEQLENLGWACNQDLLSTRFSECEDDDKGVTYSVIDGCLTVCIVNVNVDFDDERGVIYTFRFKFDTHTVVVDSDYSDDPDHPKIVGDVSESCKFELATINGPDMNCLLPGLC